MKADGTESVSSHSSVNDMTHEELTDDLYKRLENQHPVNVTGKAPSMDVVRGMCSIYKNASAATEAWWKGSPKIVVTRLMIFYTQIYDLFKIKKNSISQI